MTTRPQREISPRVIKGAIVGFDIFNPLASVVIFQYNPDTMTRTLAAQTSGGGSGGTGRAEPLRLTGAPQEDISVKVELDATDQLEDGNAIAKSMGIYPQLSALEMLLYPKLASVILNTSLLAAGTIEIVPPQAPLTILIWGAGRIVPIQLTSFSITEEAYDEHLNPIRASVNLGLRVLSYNDFNPTHPGFALFMAHQAVKEAMAVVGSVGDVAGSVSLTLGG
ncbi:MAG: hypothetical protein O7C01_03305 [Actinobacteria bacterium]|nr:hypothetical protein [Actinomycetota bacterium]